MARKKRKTAPKASPTTATSPDCGTDTGSVVASSGAAPVSLPSATKQKKTRARSFSELEDIALCQSYVSCTLNPIVGNDQKGTDFWAQVKEGFDRLYGEMAVPDNEERVPRTAESLQSRYLKKIQPEVLQWNALYKRIVKAPPSGSTKENWMAIATRDHLEKYKSYFKFTHVVDTLHALPKFDPDNDDDSVVLVEDIVNLSGDEDDNNNDNNNEKKPAAINRMMKPMGHNMRRPVGSKAAKSAKTSEETEKQKVLELKKLTASQNRLASSLEKGNRLKAMETRFKALETEFNMLKDLGDMDGARAILEQLRQEKQAVPDAVPDADASTPANSPTVLAPPFASVETAARDDESNEEDEISPTAFLGPQVEL